MDSKHLFLFVVTMSVATFLTRIAAFLLPQSVAEMSAIKVANQILPPAILTLLVMYSLKDANYSSTPYGIPELASLGAVLAIHLWRRNALLSILFGTMFFMFLKQIVFAV